MFQESRKLRMVKPLDELVWLHWRETGCSKEEVQDQIYVDYNPRRRRYLVLEVVGGSESAEVA